MRTKRTWKVTAQSFDRITGDWNCIARTEIINTDNILFADCILPIDVKTVYESFWNDVNPISESVVFVQEVVVL